MERPEQPNQEAPSSELEQQEQEQKLRSARAEAHGAIRAHAATQDRQRTSAENPNFVGDYFAASRLHFIGSWKTRFEQLLSTLPPPQNYAFYLYLCAFVYVYTRCILLISCSIRIGHGQ